MSDTSVDVTNVVADAGSTKRTSYIIIAITAVLALIFIILAVYSVVTKSLLFPKFSGPQDSEWIYPGGEIVTLTPEQVQARKALLSAPPTS